MNIIEFLIEDHSRLLRDRLELRGSLSEGILLRNKIKRYIADFELHETIEHKFLLLQLKTLPEKEKLDELIVNYEKEHEKIWNLISKLFSVVKTQNFSTIQQLFFEFFAFVEAHVGAEERTFFPTAQKFLDDKILEELGQKAEKYYERYHHPLEKV